MSDTRQRKLTDIERLNQRNIFLRADGFDHGIKRVIEGRLPGIWTFCINAVL